MTNQTAEKSQLARLMATENLHVFHSKTFTTASFDLKTRTLHCPIWSEMSGDIYDLLMGHEVGHALHTPPDKWGEAVKDQPQGFHTFLNVVEDARIERLMQRKFPGLTRSFRRGYQEFHNRDFFGVKDKSINSLSLIERLNLRAKRGPVSKMIVFLPSEVAFLQRFETTNTWEEVEALAKDLYAYAKDEAPIQPPQQPESDELSEEFDGLSDDSDDSQMNTMMSDDSDEESGDQSGNASDELSDDPSETASDEFGASQGTSNMSQDDPHAQTQEHFQRSIEKLAETGEEMVCTLPKPRIAQIVTPVQRVLTEYRNYYRDLDSRYLQRGKELLDEFRAKNQSYISMMAQEFIRQRAATTYKKNRIAETGDLNMSRLYRYRLLDETIFKRQLKVAKGQSHGLVILVDRSGSMTSNIRQTIEQLCVLMSFCKMVNIPCTAYGFHDSHDLSPWDHQPGNLHLDRVRLRELISTELSATDFQDAMLYQLMIARAQSGGVSRYHSAYDSAPYPHTDRLGTTPLNEALVAMEPLIRAFREKVGAELVQMVILQDGQTDGNSNFVHADGSRRSLSHKVFLRDDQLQHTWLVKNQYGGLTAVLLDWLKRRTGIEVIGLYLTSFGRSLTGSLSSLYQSANGDRITNHEMMYTIKKQLRAEKMLESYAPGYTRFLFLVNEQEATMSLDSLDNGATKGKIGKMFAQMSGSKRTQRLFVKALMPLIATRVVTKEV